MPVKNNELRQRFLNSMNEFNSTYTVPGLTSQRSVKAVALVASHKILEGVIDLSLSSFENNVLVNAENESQKIYTGKM